MHYPGADPAALEIAQAADAGRLRAAAVLRGGLGAAADQVVASSRLILPATSFGGVESTWERRGRWAGETAPAGLIRLSVGVEPAADLIADIDHALDTLEVP